MGILQNTRAANPVLVTRWRAFRKICDPDMQENRDRNPQVTKLSHFALRNGCAHGHIHGFAVPENTLCKIMCRAKQFAIANDNAGTGPALSNSNL
jgi:hypothetical protein